MLGAVVLLQHQVSRRQTLEDKVEIDANIARQLLGRIPHPRRQHFGAQGGPGAVIVADFQVLRQRIEHPPERRPPPQRPPQRAVEVLELDARQGYARLPLRGVLRPDELGQFAAQLFVEGHKRRLDRLGPRRVLAQPPPQEVGEDGLQAPVAAAQRVRLQQPPAPGGGQGFVPAAEG